MFKFDMHNIENNAFNNFKKTPLFAKYGDDKNKEINTTKKKKK